jgi:23S rRNA pseudouridine2605 synthase
VEERLQKILARAGFASRRGAEQLMVEGRVTVNGEYVRELGTKADLATDDVRVDGVRVKAPQAHVYLVLNKPRGVVTTRKDPAGRPTVMDLVPHVAGLFPVGRLDVTTEGLILLTNDGAFAERVSHPRYEVPRVYHAKVHRVPEPETLERLKSGVRVEGDFMAVDRARVIEADNNAWVEVALHEGKQHEVKRLLEAVGHPVSKLRRVSFGPVTAKGLEPGQFRSLTPEEITGLLRGEGSPEGRTRRPPRRPRPKPRRETRPASRPEAARGESRGAAGERRSRGAAPPPKRTASRGRPPAAELPRDGRGRPRRGAPPRGGRR